MDSDISSNGWLVRFSIPLLIVILSTICFQFGVNVENISHEDSKGIFMHILYSLSLFTLGGVSLGVPVSGPLWGIRLLYFMYYLAPAVSLGALAEHLFTTARFYLRFKILKGNHFVIIGAGRVASQIPEKLNLYFKQNYKRTKLGIEVPIVIADKNKDALLSSLNNYNIQSFNAEDSIIIKNLNLGKANMIFILTDNDWVNVNLFFQLKNYFSGKSDLKKYPRIFIRIKSEDLLNELKQNHNEAHCIFFNVHIEAIKLMMNDAEMKSNIYRNWLKKLNQSSPQTIVLLGFGRFGQHMLMSYLNSNSAVLKDSIKKAIIISPNAKNEWEHYKLICSIQNKKIPDEFEFELYDSTNENIMLLNEIINQTKKDNSVLWVLGSGVDEVNLHTSTIINRISEISIGKTGLNQDLFMLIRTKTMNNSYEELVNKKNEKHILMPTYDLIGDYFNNKFKELQ